MNDAPEPGVDAIAGAKGARRKAAKPKKASAAHKARPAKAVKKPEKIVGPKGVPANRTGVGCRHCGTKDPKKFSPSFVARNDRRCAECFRSRYRAKPKAAKKARAKK
ncbi:MAG: hypothetical protein WA005_16950 [Candidatus Binataceae bacterium]